MVSEKSNTEKWNSTIESLDDFLASKNLLSNTQALLYLSVTAKGVEPVDGITVVNPEGLTAATGPHAQAFADRLNALGLKCNVVSAEEYRPAMFEKLMWVSLAIKKRFPSWINFYKMYKRALGGSSLHLSSNVSTYFHHAVWFNNECFNCFFRLLPLSPWNK